MKFVKVCDDYSVDCSGLVSSECFTFWLSSRKSAPKFPHESFRRTLTAHLSGLDRRKPFSKEVEANLLKILRGRKVWPCFENIPGVTIGTNGFRTKGFHEKSTEGSAVKCLPVQRNGVIMQGNDSKSSSDKRPLSEIASINEGIPIEVQSERKVTRVEPYPLAIE